ncbi:MAG: hypothetical protein MJ071_01485 [Oscillospiraceae bacterium]|nr:hypothetical protein [Oscillospiraceae bacterium]
MNHMRKMMALTMAAAILSAASCLTSCGEKSNVGEKGDTPSQTVYSPVVPENPLDDDAPGDTTSAAIGDTVNFEGKLDISLDQVVEIDDVNKTMYRVMVAEMTITNHTSEPLDCSTLTHFSATVDGEKNMEAVRDVQAAVVARKYYTKINSDMLLFNKAIPAGATEKGYVYLYAPTAWDSFSLEYTPYKYYSNNTVSFNLEEGKFVHYSESIND